MSKVEIIAEAGVNHNGNIDLAMELIDQAKIAGADYVKFQSFRTETLVVPQLDKAEYQKKLTERDQTQYEMLKSLELSKDDHQKILNKCIDAGIRFLSTPFDIHSAQFLIELGVDRFKIPSGELTNRPLLEYAATTGIPIIMSTGMASMEEIEDSYHVLTSAGVQPGLITLLQCTTEYPAPIDEVNLSAMSTMRSAFNCKIGYSDHTLGIEIPIAAVAMGATVIEKHFTLDRNLEGPDHAASLEPDELGKLIKAIRNVELALGDGKKTPTKSESKNIKIARKSIHIKRDMKCGEIISADDLIMLRPGDGISPMHYPSILGKELVKDKQKLDQLNFEDFK